MSELVERLRAMAALFRRAVAEDCSDAALFDASADRIAELEARVKVLDEFNSELRRYLYDRKPERREKVVERFALNPSARSE